MSANNLDPTDALAYTLNIANFSVLLAVCLYFCFDAKSHNKNTKTLEKSPHKTLEDLPQPMDGRPQHKGITLADIDKDMADEFKNFKQILNDRLSDIEEARQKGLKL